LKKPAVKKRVVQKRAVKKRPAKVAKKKDLEPEIEIEKTEVRRQKQYAATKKYREKIKKLNLPLVCITVFVFVLLDI
jgi:hypothetical protein